MPTCSMAGVSALAMLCLAAACGEEGLASATGACKGLPSLHHEAFFKGLAPSWQALRRWVAVSTEDCLAGPAAHPLVSALLVTADMRWPEALAWCETTQPRASQLGGWAGSLAAEGSSYGLLLKVACNHWRAMGDQIC